ncbi:MAG: hypothetical protein V4475_04850 [Pseudomonadota bacterium]
MLRFFRRTEAKPDRRFREHACLIAIARRGFAVECATNDVGSRIGVSPTFRHCRIAQTEENATCQGARERRVLVLLWHAGARRGSLSDILGRVSKFHCHVKQ